MTYLQNLYDADWERERPRMGSWKRKGVTPYYYGLKRTRALDAAVEAVDLFLQRKKDRMQFRDDIKSGVDGGSFIKLKDKESIVGVFQGNPFDFRQHWIREGAQARSEQCSGAHCQHCIQGNKSTFRFRLNLVIHEGDGVFVAKVFEQGLTVYEALRELHKDYPLPTTLVKITRTGTDRHNTSYMVMPMPNGALTPEKLAKVKAVKLHDLKAIDQQPAEPQSAPDEQGPPPYFNEF